MKIAFVGLGAMGKPMAKNLLKAGYEVAGFDLNPAALAYLTSIGGKAYQDVKQACHQADALVLMVVNAEQAEDVLFTKQALDALAPNACVILCATCSPARVADIAKRVEEKQRRFIDCPVSGGIVGAEAGSLTMMAAAPDALIAEFKPVLITLGSRFYHVGQNAGQGAAVKVINQLLCGVHIVAAAEALALGENQGLDTTQLLEIFGGSAASSWMLNNRGERMVQDEPQVTSAIDIFVKDMGLVMDMARSSKANVFLSPLTEQLFRQASAKGLGRADDSQVIQVYR
jgi:L-threonate 2-dehydrogenase